ncbi:MAG TPA: FAD-dependent oxidoreductase [Solirubrobacteraceae bacterium]|nr:FAD-dependent oxidoreductase [Solirubrobacteraceae bacterium]
MDEEIAYPKLSPAALARLRSYGEPQDVEPGEVMFADGDPTYDLIFVQSGAVEVVRAATRDAPEEVLVRVGRGNFVGELGLLTGQAVYLTARVAEAGRVYRIPPAQVRRLMSEEAELSDVLLRAFLARRQRISEGPGSLAFEILGRELSAPAMALRSFAKRRRLPHRWFDADSSAGRELLQAAGLDGSDLPVVLTPERTLRNATPGMLAELIGFAYRPANTAPADLTVVGAGPAGLAAAVYGASEGLSTVLVDAVAPGGQAAASSRIENYLGFPTGISGDELTSRAVVQAAKFGARLFSPCEVRSLQTEQGRLAVVLADGTPIQSRAVILATGAHYRSLALENWEEYVGSGIYYAATELEVKSCAGRPVTVVGGANSSGQAALYLASRESEVTIAVRGPDLGASMSRYLVDRLIADPRIDVRVNTEVTALAGEGALSSIVLSDRARDSREDRDCSGLFCFIGADPATDWLDGLALDEHGFVLTDVQLGPRLGESGRALGRAPLPFETSVPCVFAVGDVRHDSMKRVAAAVGEGSSAVRSVHAALGVLA